MNPSATIRNVPGKVQYPINPISAISATEKSACNMERAMEHYQSGNYLAAMKVCRGFLSNYEAQLLVGLSMAKYNMLPRAKDAFRAAISINANDYRGWKGLCEVLENSGQETKTLFEVYLTMLTDAKPESKAEWIKVCDKALALHKKLAGNVMINHKLRNIKSLIATYPKFDKDTIGRWRDLVYSCPSKQLNAEVDKIVMNAACCVVRDCSQTSKLEQMKCDILYAMTTVFPNGIKCLSEIQESHLVTASRDVLYCIHCQSPWAEVEAKCILMHKMFPLETLALKTLAKQYIKTDKDSLEDRMLVIYKDLYTADNRSPLAAIGFGQALLAQGNYTSAITWLTKGVAGEPQNIHGWLYLALAQLAVNNLKECHKASSKGLDLLKKKADSSSTRSLWNQLEACRSKSSVESGDTMTVIAALVECIPVQSLKTTPTDLYQKLLQACSSLHELCPQYQQQDAESLQDWKRGRRAGYNLQHAIKYWNMGIEARTDPWMFLTSILKALKQNPWNAEVFLFLGRYLWEILSETRLAKDFLKVSANLQPDDETCSLLVDICMVLQEKQTFLLLLKMIHRRFPKAKWAWLRLGLLQMKDGDFTQAEQSFWNAINADSRSDRQAYECLARNRQRRFLEGEARLAFAKGAKLQSPCFGFMTMPQLSDRELTILEAADLRAIYSDTDLWVTRPREIGVQFAFSILYAICPDLLRPVGFDFIKVAGARRAITSIYGGLGQQGRRIDWGEPDKQCAYMMRFFLIHCQFVPQLLTSYPNILTKFPTGNHLRVCCVGGGPGSDIIGLFTFLRSIGRNTRLTCHVLDKFPDWMKVWKTIQPRLPPPSVDATYSSIDMTSSDPLKRAIREILNQADIITFVKSVSPAAAFLKNQLVGPQQYPVMPVPSQRGAIPNILRTLKSGALVLYIDNRAGDQNDIFYNMAISAGLRVLHRRYWKCKIAANVVEYNAVWGSYGCKPCSSCSLQGYIFDKP